MNLSGHTKPFAVLGHPIGHTLSPAMHNAAFRELGMDAVYLAFDVEPERLLSVLNAMRDMGFAGVNLTVPHKEVAFRGLERLDSSAELLGAVNTVQFDAEGIKGYNTDAYGFLQATREAFKRDVTGASIFILGTGGAGRAVALVSAQEGAASVTLADLDGARAEAVADDIRKTNAAVDVTCVNEAGQQAEWAQRADIVVHASPVGMKEGDPALLGPEAFRDGQCFFDLIYNLPETPTMRSATTAGACASNGLGMLLHQGARAFSIWTGLDAPIETMRATLEGAVYGV